MYIGLMVYLWDDIVVISASLWVFSSNACFFHPHFGDSYVTVILAK